MSEQIKDRTTYKFERVTTYEDGTTMTDVKIFTEDAFDGCYTCTWPDVANAFLCWLGGVYHYDIRGQVKLPEDYEDTFSKRFFDAEKAKGTSYDDI